MPDAPFALELTDADKAYMGSLVRTAIEQGLQGKKVHDIKIPDPTSQLQSAPLGAFVTLKRKGQLRGCIGTVQGSAPLCATLADMAYASAFRDTRFKPLTPEEYADVDIEISIMGPVTKCPGAESILIGRHGLILRRGARSGLLLPQVPVELGWDVPAFLEHLCLKAGVPPGSWQEPDAELYWFEAVRFDLEP